MIIYNICHLLSHTRFCPRLNQVVTPYYDFVIDQLDFVDYVIEEIRLT